ncbi:MAG TPA: hypothetical protein VE870_07695, partial [Bacteroidales bacterium]|nr:hypothetical protein [Bacteroidales bacterium]
MKVIQTLIGMMALLIFSNIQVSAFAPDEGISSQGDPDVIWSSSSLEGIVSSWIADFNKSNPGGKVTLSVEAAGNIEGEGGTLGFMTSGEMAGSTMAGAWRMVVGREVIVPVTNAGSPYLDILQKNGFSEADFMTVYSGSTDTDHRIFISDDNEVNLLPLLPADDKVMSYVTAFLKTDRENLKGVFVEGDEMLAKIFNNKQAIGFCRLNDLLAFNEAHGHQALS